MSASTHITPELEDLIRDIAADRDAVLLRIPQQEALRAVFDQRIDVTPNATGLTPAERQLVRVHRAELAYVLRVACVDRLHRSEIGSQRMIRDVRPDSRIPTDIGDRGRKLARRALTNGIARRADADNDAAWLTELLTNIQDDGPLTVTQLAAVSLRLVPTRQARCYQGLDLAFTGQTTAALSLFLELAELDGDRENQAIAWTGAAMIYCDTGKLLDEFVAIQSACAIEPSLLMSQAERLLTAIELGRMSVCSDAASHLDRLISVGHPAVYNLVEYGRRTSSRNRSLARSVIQSRSALQDSLGPVSTRILDAFN